MHGENRRKADSRFWLFCRFLLRLFCRRKEDREFKIVACAAFNDPFALNWGFRNVVVVGIHRIDCLWSPGMHVPRR